MRIINNSNDITALEVGDKVVFGDLEYVVDKSIEHNSTQYYLYCPTRYNGIIFEILNFRKKDFVEKLGIDADCYCDFPETKSLEALTAIVSALFKEYEKQNELPKTWEEFCERNPLKMGECLISPYCDIYITEAIGVDRHAKEDRNYCISKQEAEAFLILMQLRQLRKAYVKNWEPDWTNDDEPKYCINLQANSFDVQCWYHMSNPFSFPTARLAKQFLDNFRDLLEIAKPLL